jgi:hypothetical protein
MHRPHGLMSLQLAPRLKPIEPELLAKHFKRKHGPGDYYGQQPLAGVPGWPDRRPERAEIFFQRSKCHRDH